MGEVVAVLPALNEADALPEALAGAPAWLDVVVVDNASTDDTAAVAAALGARVVHEPFRGYGAAVQRGLAAADGAAYITILDADATFDWADLEALLAPLRVGGADVVFGRRVPARREPRAMPWQSASRTPCRRACAAGSPAPTCTTSGPSRHCAVTWSPASTPATARTAGPGVRVRAAHACLRLEEVDVAYRVCAGVSKVSGRPWPTVKTAAKMLSVLVRQATAIRHGTAASTAAPAPPDQAPG
jgi:hypothetical protein